MKLHLNKRSAAILMIVSALLASFGTYISLSSSPNVNDLTDIYIEPPMSPYDYIIGHYNSTFSYIKNCTTGELTLFLGDNEAFEYAFNISRGCKVYVTAGNFTDICVVLPNNTALAHGGHWTFIGSGEEVTQLNNLYDNCLFENSTEVWNPFHYLTLEDMTLRSNISISTPKAFMRLAWWNIRFNRLRIMGYFSDTATAIEVGGSGAPCIPSSIKDCIFINDGGLAYGYFIKSWMEGLIVDNCVFDILGNDMYGLIYCLGTTLTVTHPIVFFNQNRDISVAFFYAYDSSFMLSVTDLFINKYSTHTPTYYIFRGVAGCTIYCRNVWNDFSSTLSLFHPSDACINYKFEGTYNGYYFENSGYSGNTTATTVDIQHYLINSPTDVSITFKYAYAANTDFTYDWSVTNTSWIAIHVYTWNATSLPAAWQVSWTARYAPHI